ncbi:TIGR04500 family putative peptide maturation system protein [Rhodococcus gannanensis]|uniref:TIGR04500 family putative peptide maturation system protein n=1 Tax=Rhodococcus gannanensis TaxID=1960308 RepID=A0ABW4P1L7_9NOCA
MAHPTDTVTADDSPTTLLADALGLLRRLDPREAGAERALEPLRACHPGSRMRLLRHREAVDESVHFGLLITEPGAGTTTLSWTPEHAVPWSLRGSQRTAESMLLRVNGEPLAIEEAMGYLDVLWEETQLLERLVTVCLVRQELAERPVRLDPEALQHAMDAFRRARGLLTPDATGEWMRERGLGIEALEDLVEREAAIAELKARILAERPVDRSELDRARIVRVRFTERSLADAFVAMVRGRTGACDVRAVASAAAGAFAVASAVTGTEFLEVPANSVGRSAAGTVLGPHADGDGDGWTVTQVVAVFPATPGPRTDRQVADLAFERWVADRRRDARIEWFWGPAAKTPTGAVTST